MSSIRTGPCLAAAVVALALAQGGAAADGKKQLQLRQDEAQTVSPAATLAPKVLKGAAAPDLVVAATLPAPNPVEGLPNQGYCYKQPVGGPADRVRFAVRNDGSAPAPVTTARVTFTGVGADDTTIVALAPGQQRIVTVDIPAGCYPATAHGSCNFVIAVDADTVVVEASESNNVVLSHCLLPGT